VVHFDQRLEPQQAARTVANQFNVGAAFLGCCGDGGGGLIGTHTECGSIARDE
jgi:hypothetical protein